MLQFFLQLFDIFGGVDMAKKSRVMTEKQVLGKLQISNFGQLADDKIKQFDEMTPFMDEKTIKNAIQSFSDFEGMSKNLLVCHKELMQQMYGEYEKVLKLIFSSLDYAINALNLLTSKKICLRKKQVVVDLILEVVSIDKQTFEKEDKLKQKLALVTSSALSIVSIISFLLHKNK